jgi:hypothetical protein
MSFRLQAAAHSARPFRFPWPQVYIVQYGLGYKIIQQKMANAENTIARGGIIQELLPAMKLIKYYAWERFFEANINQASAHIQNGKAAAVFPGSSLSHSWFGSCFNYSWFDYK